jgi:hypothetical protein
MKRAVSAIVFAATLAFATTSFAATIWTLSASATNPNAEWSAGIYLDDYAATGPGDVWTVTPDRVWPGTANLYYYGNDSTNSPNLACGEIFNNPTSTPYVSGNQWLAPGDVGFYPADADGNYQAFVRWTAPRDMTVSVDAVFTGQDNVGATTGAHVLLNGDLVSGVGYTGTSLFYGVIDGNVGNASLGIAAFGSSPSQHYASSSDISVHAGNYIDFFVDKYNGSLTNDLTVVHATITETPEPASVILLASALIGLLAYAWRKRK